MKGGQLMRLIKDWPRFHGTLTCQAVEKGWSKDKKFYIKDKKGEEYLLAVSGLEAAAVKEREFRMKKKVHRLGINMSVPLEFGTSPHADKVFLLPLWMAGDPLDEVLAGLSEEKQYQLGQRAGRIQKKCIHYWLLQNRTAGKRG